MKKYLAITAFAVALAGCAAGSTFEMANARQIKPGMSETDVIALIGKPYTKTVRVGDEVWTWANYNMASGESKVVTVIFVDGTVQSIPGAKAPTN